jgi:hypothetical protein
MATGMRTLSATSQTARMTDDQDTDYGTGPATCPACGHTFMARWPGWTFRVTAEASATPAPPEQP